MTCAIICNPLVNDASALCERTALQPLSRLRSRAYLSREGERTHDANLKKPATPLVVPSTVNIHVAAVRTMSQRERLRTISNSLCEKAYKEDGVSTREAISPRIETSLSTQIRRCSVSTFQSISKIFGLVKGNISNFVHFSFIQKYQYDNEAVSCQTICGKFPHGKKREKLDILSLTD